MAGLYGGIYVIDEMRLRSSHISRDCILFAAAWPWTVLVYQKEAAYRPQWTDTHVRGKKETGQLNSASRGVGPI